MTTSKSNSPQDRPVQMQVTESRSQRGGPARMWVLDSRGESKSKKKSKAPSQDSGVPTVKDTILSELRTERKGKLI